MDKTIIKGKTVRELCETTRKVTFSKKKQAQTAASYQRQTGVRIYTYKCPHCNNWHLTKRRPENV